MLMLVLSKRALAGFILSLTPLACDLMGWRGAGSSGAASTGKQNPGRTNIKP